MLKTLSSILTALALAAAPLAAQDAKPQEELHPRSKGFSLSIGPEGYVELTVREEDAAGKLSEKTYKADSILDFKKKYPEIAKKYRIDGVTGEPLPGLGKDDPGKFFEEWKRRFDRHWFWDHDGDLDQWWKNLPKGSDSDELGRWFEEQRKLFEKFRQIPPPSGPEGAPKHDAEKGSRSFGILIAPLGDTLAHQLCLEATQGVIIADIKKGSLAEKSGLRKHDIVVKLNDKVVAGTADFRKNVYESFEKGFTLEILRRGKHETIKVEPEK